MSVDVNQVSVVIDLDLGLVMVAGVADLRFVQHSPVIKFALDPEDLRAARLAFDGRLNVRRHLGPADGVLAKPGAGDAEQSEWAYEQPACDLHRFLLIRWPMRSRASA